MAKKTRDAAAAGPEEHGADWDGAFDGPEVPAEPAAPMPARAAKLPSQNGSAMRSVFAYLLDEDAPPPEPAPPKGKRRKG